jgi:ADP-ribose pyrophosphatase YjhB (NUDIX family)
MERFKMIASGYVFFIKDNKILLLKRKNTGYMDGMYGLPSGHIEDNERISQGTCREIKEEIDIELKPDDISLVHIMHRKEKDIRIDFFFLVNKWQGKPINAEFNKCDGLQWFSFNSLPDNTIPYIKIAIENFQNKLLYYEIGWE